MTKLTQEQVEKERAAFENAWREIDRPDCEQCLKKNADMSYINDDAYNSFSWWLARAELANSDSFIVVGKKVIPNNIAKLMSEYDMPWEVFWCDEHKKWINCLDSLFPYHIEQNKCPECLRLQGLELANKEGE